MGAETKCYVEVETVRTEWRESYGVTEKDAIANVSLSHKETATGVVVTPDHLKRELDALIEDYKEKLNA